MPYYVSTINIVFSNACAHYFFLFGAASTNAKHGCYAVEPNNSSHTHSDNLQAG
jgi:hypothetical protein